MDNFKYYSPTEIIFGRDTEQEVGKEIKKHHGSRVMLVYGQGSVVKSGILDTVKEALEQEAITYTELGGVKPNPHLDLAEEGVRRALDFQVDFILAVGGGSAIDTAKGIAHGAVNPGTPLWDLWTGKTPLKKPLPVGCILTIAAAGSETSDSAVLTNTEIGKKAGLSTDLNRPVFAIMNPELTYTLPRYQIACGIVDIMMHTLERYFIPAQKNRMTDEIAEGLLRTVISSGRVAYHNPQDYDAMSELMWCGSLSHNNLTGLGRAKDFCVHKFGHALGARFDKAHGATLSATWGSWANYVCGADPERFQHYGRQVWGIEEADPQQAARQAIDQTVAYFRSLDMPVSLPELLGEKVSDQVLYQLALESTQQNTLKLAKVKELNVNDVYEIFKQANS